MLWRYSALISRTCWLAQKTSASSIGLTIANRAYGSLKRIAGSFTQFNSDPFNEEDVRKCHRWDKLSDREWVLVYRDGGSSKTHSVASVLIPIFACAFVIFIGDVLFNQEHFGYTQRILNDARELGGLVIIPVFLSVFACGLLFRIQSNRLMRIYQNRKDPFNFVVIVPRLLLLQKKLPFFRGEASVVGSDSSNYLSMAEFLRNVLYGTISIKGKSYTHLDDNFVSNSIRSFMLNESNLVVKGDAIRKRRRNK